MLRGAREVDREEGLGRQRRRDSLPARTCTGFMAKMPKFMVVRCTLCCRPVGFDVLAGFPIQAG